MFPNRAVSLALVGLFVCMSACTTYKQIEPIDAGAHDHVVVTTTDGERQSLYEPEVAADSIRGKVERSGQVTRAYPFDQVAELQSVGTHDVGTAAVVIVVGIGLLMVGLAIGS